MNSDPINMNINMNDANIGGNEMVFSINNDGACSGGFNVNSIMMKTGMSPITTLQTQSGGNNVSDLFGGNLVIPSWLLSYSTMNGGVNKGVNRDEKKDKNKDDDSDDECIDDKLYETLLDLVREPLHKLNHPNKVIKTKRNRTRKGNKSSTKRQKI
jgi:hypothetical protein